MKLVFGWNEVKAKENIKKHKVLFEEGKTVFNDHFLLTYSDVNNPETEERYINIGVSAKDRILVLIHTERQGKQFGYSTNTVMNDLRYEAVNVYRLQHYADR